MTDKKKTIKAWAVVEKTLGDIYFIDLDFNRGIQRWGVFREDEKKLAKLSAKEIGGKVVKVEIKIIKNAKR